MEALDRILRVVEAELARLEAREQFVRNHIRSLEQKLEDRTLTRERRRQLVIEMEDYWEELDLNLDKQISGMRDLTSIRMDQRDLAIRLANEAQKN